MLVQEGLWELETCCRLLVVHDCRLDLLPTVAFDVQSRIVELARWLLFVIVCEGRFGSFGWRFAVFGRFVAEFEC